METNSDNVTPSTIHNDDKLRMKIGNSIGDTLKNELGIGCNDVSSNSPDHASSVEPLLAERI